MNEKGAQIFYALISAGSVLINDVWGAGGGFPQCFFGQTQNFPTRTNVKMCGIRIYKIELDVDKFVRKVFIYS